jgi:hypothetical protein
LIRLLDAAECRITESLFQKPYAAGLG